MKGYSIVALAGLTLALAGCSQSATPTQTAAATLAADTPAQSTTAPTAVPPTSTPSGQGGSISGAIIPIGAAQPATSLKIFAVEKNAGTVYTADLPPDQTTYKIGGLPPGVYNVFAWYYPKGLAGAYTSLKTVVAGTSSEQFDCTNSLVDVPITKSAMEFSNADIGCWGGNYFSYFPIQP